MDAELRPQPDGPAGRFSIILEAVPAWFDLPVFVGFDALFPFAELSPKKYQLSSRF
ncbi:MULTISPECIES: hypothetical protein [unclassified Rhizobium]|uniref:hypothetical protein n=1 Tax=unclassified Rhizobium TaxID=2613769 RepID=UPI0007F0BD87|nr:MULTISPECIES: hypothetical protein [unclassified Rhizobium]ANM11480.1 hypothetical protein AMK05_CH03116 [Rhizobium sp. N324]ANM17953.1 hypothetical protein AMK06_CH03073 [Rhizobium sp. N541]ANM24339.1 hypothetical protein AMK07_CH03071 [Rhizobium sp. N941]OYD05085.1 hypothetical protein AMK08_CH103135 [Rhizobium sp. N4311]